MEQNNRATLMIPPAYLLAVNQSTHKTKWSCCVTLGLLLVPIDNHIQVLYPVAKCNQWKESVHQMKKNKRKICWVFFLRKNPSLLTFKHTNNTQTNKQTKKTRIEKEFANLHDFEYLGGRVGFTDACSLLWLIVSVWKQFGIWL